MNLSVGIVGMPNVGKSTLFNALLKKQVAYAANYPFATIEPNVGVVEVPDPRLAELAKIVGTEKIVPAAVEFVDIAGLVKGASKGEGLGNKFLAAIREVAVIAHVVRLFEDTDIIRNSPQTSPDDDITIIEEELMLADLATLEKQKEPKGAASKEEKQTWQVVFRVKETLNKGVAVRAQGLNSEQQEAIRPLNLLTAKPVIYCFNCSLDQLERDQETQQKVKEFTPNLLFNPLVDETVDELIKKAYSALGLISFLTAGEKEARAWTIPAGLDAQHAAGAIHNDFVKHFIKADVIPFEEFVAAGGWAKAREVGKVISAGRDYIMKDGDVVDFKVGV